MDPMEAGTEVDEGQATGPLEAEGQPGVEGNDGQPQAGAEPGAEIGPEHKSYKEIQRAFTEKSQKLSDIEKRFSSFGGVDNAVQVAEFLNERPNEFRQWLQAQVNPEPKEEPDIYSQLGLQDVDPESRQGIDLVSKIADMKAQKIAEQQVGPLKEQLQQLIQANKVEKIKGYLGDLRKDPDFSDIDEYREQMVEIAGMLSPEKKDNLTLEDMKDLYFLSVRKSGKWDEKLASSYEKRLSAKKARSVDKPDASAGSSGKKQAKTLEEAFAAAKESLGVAL